MALVIAISGIAVSNVSRAEETDETNMSLFGKKILFVGDSITYASDNKGWAGRIQEQFGAVTTKAGVSGASISTVRPDNRVISQLETNKNNQYDYVILHGGVNDAWDRAPVGTISNSFNIEDFDTSTFAGGLEELICYAFENFETAKIGYIINYSRPNASSSVLRNMSAYFLEAKKICEKWGISYLDLYFGTTEVEGVEIAYSKDLLKTASNDYFTASGDIHLAASGYDVISPYIGKWITTIQHNNYHGTYGNPLAGKSALFVGDSITAASSDEQRGWAGRIAGNNGMTFVNAGVGGATVSTKKENRIINQFQKQRLNKYDYVIMHGGVNDAMTMAPIGTVSTSRDIEDFDTSTFAGALEELFYNAYQYQGTAKLGYIVNYATPNSGWGGYTQNMKEYFDVAKQVCEKWNISYIDLFEGTVEVNGQTLSYSYDILKVNEPTYFLDSESGQAKEVHISSDGYDVIAPYIAEWMKTLENQDESVQTYEDWTNAMPLNGDFEVGYDGMEVYGWHLVPINAFVEIDYSNEAYATKNHKISTMAESNNKVVLLERVGGGYAAMASQPFKVVGGKTYEFSLDYKTTEVTSTNGTSTDFHGIRLVVQELDKNGDQIAWNKCRPIEGEGYGRQVSTDWEQISHEVTLNEKTTTAVVYIAIRGGWYMRAKVLLDNMKAQQKITNKSLLSNNFEEGQENELADWTLIPCGTEGQFGNQDQKYAENYNLSLQTENDNSYMRIMPNSKTRGYALAQSSYLSVQPYQDYILSYDLKAEGNADANGNTAFVPRVRVYYYKADKTYLSEESIKHNYEDVQNWSSFTYKFSVPNNAVYMTVNFYIGGGWDKAAPKHDIDNVNVIIRDSKGWEKETTDAVGTPRDDGTNFTQYWDIMEANDGLGHESAWKLSVNDGQRSFGGVTFYQSPIHVVGGEDYNVSFDYKLNGHLNVGDTNTAYGAAFVIRYFDAEGNQIDKQGTVSNKPHALVSGLRQDTVDWLASDVYEISVPSNAVTIQYGLTIGTGVVGSQDLLEYYFDHIVIAKTADYEIYANNVRENRNATDFFFVMLQDGDIVSDDGIVSVVDLVRMKKYAVNNTLATGISFSKADMNKNNRINDDDLTLLRWKLVGIKKTSDLIQPSYFVEEKWYD